MTAIFEGPPRPSGPGPRPPPARRARAQEPQRESLEGLAEKFREKIFVGFITGLVPGLSRTTNSNFFGDSLGRQP